MPNHIKNRITLSGDQQKINVLIEKLSTFYPKTERTAYDGSLIYIHKETNEPGWLDVGSQIFTRRGENDSQSIPDGFEQAFEPAWTRFPDFNKIVPMPDELHINSDGWVMPLENQFSYLTIFKDHLDKMRDHFESDHVSKTETLENFIQGIRNYVNYGHATWHSFSCEHWGTKWNAYSCEKLAENVFEFETAWSGVPAIICKMSCQFPDVKIEYEYSDEDTGSNCGKAIFQNGIGEVVRYKSQSNEAYELAFKLRPSVMEYYELVEGRWQYKDDD